MIGSECFVSFCLSLEERRKYTRNIRMSGSLEEKYERGEGGDLYSTEYTAGIIHLWDCYHYQILRNVTCSLCPFTAHIIPGVL